MLIIQIACQHMALSKAVVWLLLIIGKYEFHEKSFIPFAFDYPDVLRTQIIFPRNCGCFGENRPRFQYGRIDLILYQ